jgi:hypothetical protein
MLLTVSEASGADDVSQPYGRGPAHSTSVSTVVVGPFG